MKAQGINDIYIVYEPDKFLQRSKRRSMCYATGNRYILHVKVGNGRRW